MLHRPQALWDLCRSPKAPRSLLGAQPCLIRMSAGYGTWCQSLVNLGAKQASKLLQENQIRFTEPEMFWMKFCMPFLVNQGFGRFLTSFAVHITTQGMEICSAMLQTQHRETAPCLEMWPLQCGLVFLASFVSSQYDLCLYYSWRLSSLVHIMSSLHCDFFVLLMLLL